MVRQVVQVNVFEDSQVSTFADLIIYYLLQIDVEYIFGVPGGAIEPLYNAIGRNLRRPVKPTNTALPVDDSVIPVRNRGGVERIKPIIARHESGAAFMADGYARETGKLGVCCATTGPGATNLITGVASAYADRVPMLVITPQTALPDFGKMGLQESSSDAIDVVGMFEHCTRYNTLVSHPNQLEGKLYSALLHAFRRPRGPVHISIPMDILNSKVETMSEGYRVAHLFRQPKTVDDDAYDALLASISKTDNHVLFLGSGCRDAIDVIVAFAEQTNTPIVTTPSGKGWVSPYHPLYRGVFGFAGHESAYQTIMDENVERIIAVGTSLGELSTSGWDKGVLNDKLIHISKTADDFARSRMACLHILGDARTVFANLYKDLLINRARRAKTLPPVPGKEETGNKVLDEYVPSGVIIDDTESLLSDAVPVKPQRVMYEIAKRFPWNTRYVTDAGNAWAWTTHYLMVKEIGIQRTGFGFGAMGWAVGAAVGTAFGCPGEPVVCITGDGSYLMSGQEITVAVAEKTPMVFIVLNDEALGMVKHGQRMAGAEQIGYQLPKVDYAKMARAMGAKGITIKSPEDFDQLDMDKMFAKGSGPTLIDVHIDPEEVPPMGARVKTLNKT